MIIHTHYHRQTRHALKVTEIERILNRLAADTDTTDLVVALYFHLPGLPTRGTAYIRDWHTPETWTPRRGLWKKAAHLPCPNTLPQRYRLIRMHLAQPPETYPRTERDIYDWEFHYATQADHLAVLFAHELHHFRRYHLGMHPREGEHGANQWAIKHAKAHGFQAEGRRLPIKKKKEKKRFRFLDPYKAFRSVKAGERIEIITDPTGKYTRQTAEVIRAIRSNSKRIVIKTDDGLTWRWPMAWVKRIEQKNRLTE